MKSVESIYGLNLLRRAERDLVALLDVAATGSPAQARALASKFQTQFNRLQRYPNSGSPVRGHATQPLGFRFIKVARWLAFYIVDEPVRMIYIHRVLHAKRDYLAVLSAE